MIKISEGVSFPYFSNDIYFIVLFCLVGLLGEILHGIVDVDQFTKKEIRKQQLFAWSISFATISLEIIILSFRLIGNLQSIPFFIIFPILFLPLAIIYITRNEKAFPFGRKSIKEIGILCGNLGVFYLIILMLI